MSTSSTGGSLSTLVAARYVHVLSVPGVPGDEASDCYGAAHGAVERARSREQLVPLVEVQDITVRFGGIVALDGLSLHDRRRVTSAG